MKMLRKTLLLTIAMLLVTAVAAAAATDGTIPGAAGFPQGLAVQPGTTTFFVSSFTTGAVFRGTIGHQARLFLSAGANGRRSATGVEFDPSGRLLVLTGRSLELEVFSPRTGRLQGTFAAAPITGSHILNGLALTNDGNVYITDFGTPAIYRVTARELKHGSGPITRWLSPSARIVPVSGGGFNGIAATADGRYLIVGETASGALWRINIAKRTITSIKVRGGSLLGSDGVLLLGHTLYVATHQNAVYELVLGQTYASARVVRKLTNPTLDFPTSMTVYRNRLLVANALKPAGATEYQVTSFPLTAR